MFLYAGVYCTVESRNSSEKGPDIRKIGWVAEITMFCWQIETRFGLHYLVVREMETFLYFETQLMFLDKEYRLENLIVFFLTWMCLPVDI